MAAILKVGLPTKEAMIGRLMAAYSRNRTNKANFSRGGLRYLLVRPLPGNRSRGLINIGGVVLPCALGRGGISANKREGDGATPLARMRLISGYFRGNHRKPGPTRLPMRRIGPDLGWCEVSGDRNYNRPVTLPYAVSHERMLRDDDLYDICIVLDWNIMPRRRGRGSAIFFHLARPGFTPTQGCVAVTAAVMARLLPRLTSHTVIIVSR